MTVLPYTDFFANLEVWIESCCSHERLCRHEGECVEAPIDLCLPLDALRVAVRRPDADAERGGLWQDILGQLCQDREQRWTLIVLWLLAPRLKGMARSVARRTGADVGDVLSEVLTGAVEGMRTAVAVTPGNVEDHVLDAAYAGGRRTGKRPLAELPAEEVGTESGPLDLPEKDIEFAESEVVPVHGMTMGLVQQANGERLGAMAQRLGLMPHVRETRRLRRAGLRRADVCCGNKDIRQQELFETGEAAHDSTP